MALYGNTQLSGQERHMDANEIIVSKTDLDGRLVYGNRTFAKFADLTEKEFLGKQHNVIRHPHMPRCIFDLLWAELKAEREIFAYVNNRSANGDNYWVFAHVTPSYGDNGQVIGYHSNRRAPNREALNTHIIPLYDQLLKLELSIDSPKQALAASNAEIVKLLDQKNMSFNELMFALGT